MENLNPYQEYKFRICTFDLDEDKALYSKYCYISGKTTPTAVNNFKIGGTVFNALRLNWTKNSSAAGYIIEQQMDGCWRKITKINTNSVTTFRVENLIADSPCSFRIRAFGMDGTTELLSEWRYVSGKTLKTPPGTVNSLKIAGRTYNALRLTWEPEKTADGYIIEQYNSGRWNQVTRLDGQKTVTYRVEKLSPSQEYKFRICAFVLDNKTIVRGEYSDIAGKTTPSKPAGVKIAQTTLNSIEITWNQNAAAAGFILEKKENNNWIRLAYLKENATTTYRVQNLNADTKYEFRIRSVGYDQSIPLYSDWVYINGITDVDNVVPTNITGLKIMERSSDKITLAWNKNRTASGYNIEQYRSGKWKPVVQIIGNNITDYCDDRLSASTVYPYRIHAYSYQNSQKVYSEWSYITSKTLPSVMTGFYVESATTNSLQLTWDQNSSADGYVIEQYTNEGWVPITKIEENTVSEYNVRNLKKGTSYTFMIRAFTYEGTDMLYGKESHTTWSTNEE